MLLVHAECCDPDCPGCQGDGLDGNDPGPEQFAAELAEAVGDEYYENLLTLVLNLVDAASDEETQAYWQAVYAALTQ
jgi:hypothetical protein